ncbi:MAG: hypothetical protein JSU70_23075 [Phycisphaerales bacterium]|nr:MAG: hypothetical protein JSU70_23075 [Phycisphaerales bacterium]
MTTSGGGEGKTTAELQSANTFTTWGCNLVWTIDEGVDYPRLRWQNIPGEIIAGPSPFESVPGGGAPSDPYLIYTAEQFNMIGRFPCQWDKHFKLMADIDLSAYFLADYNVIGRIGVYAFSGVFDGNGKRIYNFSCVRAGEDNVGLFGCVGDPNAQIKNLGLIDPAVTVIAGYDVGSLVGLLEAGTITDCYVQGGTVLGQGRIGALAGSTSGTIAYCHSNASVLGPGRDIGGLVGNNSGQLSNCYCSSDVSGGDVVGGLAGANFGADDSNGLIENCHATGTVQGDDHLGGLVGGNWAGTIRSCYSAGSVKGTNNVGGLLGLNEGGLIEGSFWDVQVSGQAISDGGTGKTTAEMQTAGTFLQAGWDFVGEIENGTEDLWCICEAAGYPKLTWEFVLGDFDADGHTDFGDLGILGERWLETDSSFFCGNGGADLTGDSFVGLGDLLVLADNWLRK